MILFSLDFYGLINIGYNVRNMKKCSFCGAQIADDCRFCTECGKEERIQEVSALYPWSRCSVSDYWLFQLKGFKGGQ